MKLKTYLACGQRCACWCQGICRHNAMLKMWITKMCLKITLSKPQPHLSAYNELVKHLCGILLFYRCQIPELSSQSTNTPLKSDIAYKLPAQRVACYHRLFQHIICTGNAVLWSLVILLMQHASQHNASGGYFLGLLYYRSLSDEEPITPTPFPSQYKLIGKFILPYSHHGINISRCGDTCQI